MDKADRRRVAKLSLVRFLSRPLTVGIIIMNSLLNILIWQRAGRATLLILFFWLFWAGTPLHANEQARRDEQARQASQAASRRAEDARQASQAASRRAEGAARVQAVRERTKEPERNQSPQRVQDAQRIDAARSESQRVDSVRSAERINAARSESQRVDSVRSAGVKAESGGQSANAQAATAKPAVAPAPQTNVESEMGIPATQRAAIKGNMGKSMTTTSGGDLARVWNSVANPGQQAQLTLSNSRSMFNNQRGRFWRAVRADPAARKVITDMGGQFPINPTSAPVITLPNGTQIQITIDHITERQTAPQLALDPSNLQLSSRRENTVVLRQLHDQDPFNSPPPNWVPF